MLSKKNYFAVFYCLIIGNFSLLAQTFSVITQEAHPYHGCVQLENPPKGDSILYKKEDLKVFLFPHSPESTVAPIIGNWEKVANKLYFCPLIPFTKSLTYQTRFPNLPYFTFKAKPKDNYLLTKIADVFPATVVIPENTLKIYLYFSAPMSDLNAYEYLSLIDDKGEVLEAPFLELNPLLWNDDRTRLTLWFDPGRVKRDLIKNKKLGAPLEEGRSYTLFISQNWKDANGYSLAADFEQKVLVGRADRISPDPKNWTSTSPKANTKEPLIIYFGEALDHALVKHSLTVYTKKGNIVEGSISLNNNDKEWQFTPLSNWKSNPYRIQVKAELEDLAGNNLNRLFDTDLEKQILPTKNLPYYYFDFRVE